MRKTKIVVGLCRAGMNVARLNFSHNTHEDHKKRMDMIKEVREELGLPIAILLDTKGPEYRIKTFENGRITLNDGDKFTFTSDDVVGNCECVSVNYAKLPEELDKGDTILLNNGLLSFTVENICGKNIECRVTCGGELSDRKSMSFPGKVMKQPYLSEQDKKDIKFGVENDIDYIADILFRERWNGKSVRELREYCQDWDKTDKYGVDISKLSDYMDIAMHLSIC